MRFAHTSIPANFIYFIFFAVDDDDVMSGWLVHFAIRQLSGRLFFGEFSIGVAARHQTVFSIK